MALNAAEKEWAREVISYNGGTPAEQVRFGALTDDQAREEIAAFKENQLIPTNDGIAFHTEKLAELQAYKTRLTTN
jgi:hypothetical protein